MTELELGPLRFGIVGAGRLGTVIGRALQLQGFELVAVSSASPEGRDRAASALQVPAFEQASQAIPNADVVIVCVPDDALADVVAEIDAALTTSGQRPRIVHTSGCLPLSMLEPLAASGCDVAAVHPLQTVTERSRPEHLRGAAAAVTAADNAARIFGHALAHALGMHPFDLADEQRPLYHAAAAIAANFTVTLQAAVRECAAAAGMHEGVARHAFTALARAALDRVEHDGPAAALTGPVVRGDIATIRAHLTALDVQLPGTAALYRPLAHATVALALDSGRIDVAAASRIDQALSEQSPCV